MNLEDEEHEEPIVKEKKRKKNKNDSNNHEKLIEEIMNTKIVESLIEKEFVSKVNDCCKALENEEFMVFLKMIKEDEKLKNKIFDHKGESFRNMVDFEETSLNFFLTELNDKHNYTKIKNNNFDLSFRQLKNQTTLRFEKSLDIPIVDLLSLIYEVEFYPKWFPFNSYSKCIKQPGKAKKVVYLINSIPVISDRDFFIYGFGVNRIKENNTIMLICRSINNDSVIFAEELRNKSNKKYIRGDIYIFGFEIKLVSDKKVHVKGLVNIDPKIEFIPQWLINKVSQKVFYFYYYFLVR